MELRTISVDVSPLFEKRVDDGGNVTTDVEEDGWQTQGNSPAYR